MLAKDKGSGSALAPRGSAPRVWRFADTVLDERTLELVRDGSPLPLERKPLEILIYLLQHAGEVVTKDELADALWPGRIISDSTLTKCMAVLRRAIGDDGQSIIKTAHGYGYRLTAPVSVETQAAVPPPAVHGLQAGDAPPLRPHWRLVERLGVGGRGEVWLARHAKIAETRVYKFAADGAGLSSIKREITLYRLLQGMLPERDDFARVLDWNLDQPPFFIECEFTQGGSLLAWAEALGGLPAVPLPARLELLARVSDAVAAAHSVGVLHKDLKPPNVLAVSRDASTRIKLCDFGSGGVIDPALLEQLGITRQGFTKTVATTDTSGTLLYLAPEVLSGQPFTVKSDVYALGVMLFQLAVGDFRRALAPGWEAEVDDELLREDIAAAAAGRPEMRLGDAAMLSRNLRALPDRRQQRAAQREAAARAEREQRAMERMRIRRTWMSAAIVFLVLGLGASLGATWRAQRAQARAESAMRTARSIQAFLTEDLLLAGSISPTEAPSMPVLLERVSAQVEQRFKQDPAVSGEIFYTLGRAYTGLGRLDVARAHLDRALALLEPVHGRKSPELRPVLQALAVLAYHDDRLADAQALHDEILAYRRDELGDDHPRVLSMMADFERLRFERESFAAPAAALRALADRARRLGIPAADLTDIQLQAVAALGWDSAFVDAQALVDAVLATRIRLEGDDAAGVQEARMYKAWLLAESGRFDEAQATLDRIVEVFRERGKDASLSAAVLDGISGMISLQRGRTGEAIDDLEKATQWYADHWGPEKVETSLHRYWLVRAYAAAGRLSEAETLAREVMASHEKANGPAQPWTVRIRITLADILRQQQRLAEAAALLAATDTSSLREREVPHAWMGMFERVNGLVLHAQGRTAEAAATLAAARRIFIARYGAGSPFVASFDHELQTLGAAGAKIATR